MSNKPFWITEMQAAPWLGSPGFQPDDLIQSAYTYSAGVGAAVTLLWGVESWLGNESWMSAGATAVMAIPPLSVALGDDAVFGYYAALVEALDIPVVIQDASGYVGRPMSIDSLTKRLASDRKRSAA